LMVHSRNPNRKSFCTGLSDIIDSCTGRIKLF
jgi:hypothetical protein